MDSYTLYVHIAPNEKLYIGITKYNVKQRWYSDGSGYKSQQLFWRAIQKYGWENFKHIVLLENLSKEMACECEIALIAKFKSNNPVYGYNVYAGGNIGNKGMHLSENQIEQMRSRMLGTHHSEETKRKMSASHLGYKQTPEHIENARKARLGKKLSEEHKRKLRISHLGYKPSIEQRNKQSESLKRTMQKLTPEERKQKYGHKSHNAIKVNLYENEIFIKSFNSGRECAFYLGVSPSLICTMLSGKRKFKNYTVKKNIECTKDNF